MAEFLHKSDGPIWYRGYFKEPTASSTEIDRLLEHFNVSRIVVGHTSQKQIVSRYEGRVIGIDASMKRGLNGELLLIKGNKTWRGSLSGDALPLIAN
jgi:hypothetical protein